MKPRYERRRREQTWLTPEQLAQDFEIALRWRAEWRAERCKQTVSGPILPPAQPADELARRAGLAAAITRAEFGRFYCKGNDERVAKAANGARKAVGRSRPNGAARQ